ncbi:MAG TPA: flagellar motor switch protein FliM [Blastocatellia bacterium]|nr:flagellar motor switch protein FliM [Blastocatellia bacterium]
MSKDLLTTEEMSSLLESGAAAGMGAMPGPAAGDKRRRVVPYDFRRPDRVSKEQLRSLYLLHDLFAHSLSSSLPIFLRAISEVTLISVEQQAYVEYLYGLPDPTAIFTLAMHPLQGMAILELNPSIAFPVIDRMLGGQGETISAPRPVTEIEQRILEGFLKIVIDDLREAWKPLVELDLQITGRETRPQMLQIVAPNEVVLAIVFQVQIGEARGMMSLCLPAITLEPILQKFNQSLYSRIREVPAGQTRALLDSMARVEFPVTAEITGTKAAVDDLMRLAPGDVLRLEHAVTEAVSISVGGVAKFEGSLVARGKRMAVQITRTLRGEE